METETKTDFTLVQNLCFVAKVQGGTIHQYCNIRLENFDAFQKEWETLAAMNGMMTSREAFVQIAARTNYEGLIWRADKISRERYLSFNPEARESYEKSRGNWNIL